MAPVQDSGTLATISRTLPGPGQYMCGLAWDGTHLWHSDQEAGKIFALDPSDGAVVREFGFVSVRADLAFDGTWLTQVGGRPKRIMLVDRETGRKQGERHVLPANGKLTGTEYGPEGLWMCLREPTVVQLRDPATMAVVREFPARGSSPSGLTYADGVIIHGDVQDATLYAMDPVTGADLGARRVPGRPTGMTWDGRHVWYCDFPARSFRAVDLCQIVA